jgi:hypothetical protein
VKYLSPLFISWWSSSSFSAEECGIYSIFFRQKRGGLERKEKSHLSMSDFRFCAGGFSLLFLIKEKKSCPSFVLEKEKKKYTSQKR